MISSIPCAHGNLLSITRPFLRDTESDPRWRWLVRLKVGIGAMHVACSSLYVYSATVFQGESGTMFPQVTCLMNILKRRNCNC